MPARPEVLLARGLAVLAALLCAGTLGAVAAGAVALPNAVEDVYVNVVLALSLPWLGALVLHRAPGHRLGRLFVASGTACAVTLACFAWAQRGLVDQPGSLPGAVPVGWVSSWVWVLGGGPLIGLALLLYPDGRLLSRRWRWALVPAAAGIALPLLAMALRPGPLANHPVRDNPFGGPGSVAVYEAAGAVGFGCLLLAAAAGLAALVVRWRRATVEERAPIRWLLLAAVPLVAAAALPVEGAVALPAQLALLVTVPLLPIALAVAMVRHQLYGAVVLRRSLGLYLCTALLLAVYAGAVALLDLALRGTAGAGISLAAAGAVAVATAPLWQRAQQAVDRLLFGERGAPDLALARLGTRLQAALGTDAVVDEIGAVVAEALHAPSAAVVLPGEAVPAGCVVPLSAAGLPVGMLVVADRSDGAPYGPRDHALLEHLAAAVSGTVHAVLLDRDLVQARDRLARAREEERRRLRRDLHDGLGPALTGVAFGLDAVRRSLPTRPDDADGLLGELTVEVQAAVAEVRRIADDLAPGALAELGLVAALRRYASRLATGAMQIHVEADELPPLPAAVEAAAYRIAVEALTNAARHAHARSCAVVVRLAGDALHVRVSDDGLGVPAQRQPGVGLASMAERAVELGGTCCVGPAPGGGTEVDARLPAGVTT